MLQHKTRQKKTFSSLLQSLFGTTLKCKAFSAFHKLSHYSDHIALNLTFIPVANSDIQIALGNLNLRHALPWKIQCGSFVWNPPTLSFFHVKIFTKRLCRPFLQPKNYRKMISYHTKVTRPLFDERLKKNLRYFP